MTAPATSLRAAVNTCLEGIGVNRAEALALFNPTPEVDSHAERLVALAREYGIPQRRLRPLLHDLRAIIDLNELEHGHHQVLAGSLGELARVAHLAEKGLPTTIGVKAIARAARPALRVLRQPRKHTASEYVAAARAIDDLIAEVPRDRLLSRAVRGELGLGPHAQLMRLLDERSVVA